MGLLAVTALVAPMAAPVEAHAAANPSRLERGERLDAGESLVSPNGKLQVVMQGDGNLVLYAPGMNARWSSGTSGNPGAWAQLNGDGNLVVYGPGNVPLWNAFAEGARPGGTFAQIQDDGNFVLYNATPAATWNTGTFYFPARIDAPGSMTPGMRLQSPNGRFTLVLQGDGNLVLYGADGSWIWQTNTPGTPVTQLAIQRDGNLVLYTGTGYVWQSQSYGQTGGFFQVQDDGNVVYYTPSATPIWHSNAATNIVKQPAPGSGLLNPHGSTTVSSGWTPRAQWVADRFRAAFPNYTCNGQAPRANAAPGSDHPYGNGIDCSHRAGTDDRATGDRAAGWLLANAGPLRIKYVIWWGVQYMPNGTSRAFEGHRDHIHISVL